jgi:hypothetical protein
MEEQISRIAGALVQLKAKRCLLFGDEFSCSAGWDILLMISSMGGTIRRAELEQSFSDNPVVFDRWISLLTDRGLILEGKTIPCSNGSRNSGLIGHPSVVCLAGWAEDKLAVHLLEVGNVMAKLACGAKPQAEPLPLAPD